MKWVTEKLKNGMFLTRRAYEHELEWLASLPMPGCPTLKETDDKVYYDFMFGPKEPTDLVPWNYYSPALPPLKVFLGWTPMKEFISKCKPFVPSDSNPIHWLEIKQIPAYIPAELMKLYGETGWRLMSYEELYREFMCLPPLNKNHED